MSRNTRTASLVALTVLTLMTSLVIGSVAFATETTDTEANLPVVPNLVTEEPANALAPEDEAAIEAPAVALPTVEMILATVIDDCQLQCHDEWRTCRRNAQSAQSHDDCLNELEACLANECGIGC